MAKKSRPVPETNAAIRRIVAKHSLLHKQVAQDCFVSEATVASWYRELPTTAPRAAVVLLCTKYNEPWPECLGGAQGKRSWKQITERARPQTRAAASH